MLLISTLLHFSSSDTQSTKGVNLERQALLLNKFFSKMPKSFIAQNCGSRDMRDICTCYTNEDIFFGCAADNETITSIDISHVHEGNFLVSYLPSTVTNLDIMHCKQSYKLHTRLLPAALRIASFYTNRIYGTIDLQHLPEKLEWFDVSKNRIVGPIALIGLPRTLQRLRLQSNRIKQDFLYYEDLPLQLERVGLGENQIQSVKSLSGKDETDVVFCFAQEGTRAYDI